MVTQADSYPNHNPRFETWVVTQADSSPIRLRFETWVVSQADSYPNHNPCFETWVVTQADSSPIRLRSETWVVTQADSYPNHNPRFETWVVTQADLSPIRLRFETWVVTQADSPPIRLCFETWVVTQADSYSNRNPRFKTWVVTQADSSPIRARITIPVSRPGWSPRPIRPKLRFETSFKSRFPNQVEFIFIAGPSRVPSPNKINPTSYSWFSKHMPHKKMRTW